MTSSNPLQSPSFDPTPIILDSQALPTFTQIKPAVYPVRLCVQRVLYELRQHLGECRDHKGRSESGGCRSGKGKDEGRRGHGRALEGDVMACRWEVASDSPLLAVTYHDE